MNFDIFLFPFYTKRLFMSPTPIGTIASSLFCYKTSWFNAQIVLAVVTRKSFRVTLGFFQCSFLFSFSLSSPLHFLFSPTSSPFHYLPPPSLFSSCLSPPFYVLTYWNQNIFQTSSIMSSPALHSITSIIRVASLCWTLELRNQCNTLTLDEVT